MTRIQSTAFVFLVVITSHGFLTPNANCDPVILQQATATFSQSNPGSFPVSMAIDGLFGNSNGWAIFADGTSPQTAVFETTSNIGFVGGSEITFTLSHVTGALEHMLGRFRLSVTTDSRDDFANGSGSGGDVSANWLILDPIQFSSSAGTTLTELGDSSILAILGGGSLPTTDVYTVIAHTELTGITGFRLEALADPMLPDNGPGLASNGNFVLSEIEIDIGPIPEPDIVPLLGCVVAPLIARRKKQSLPSGQLLV